MKRFFGKKLKTIVAHLGYELHPLGPLDLRGKTEHPIEASYLSGRRHFLIDVPLSHCRGFCGFPFTNVHPFVRTVRDYLEGRSSTYEGSPLERYYEFFQPRHAADLLAIRSPSRPLYEISPSAFMMPWDPRSAAKRARQAISENQRRGGARLSLRHGLAIHGPVSKEKGTIEYSNLIELVRSIRDNGYVRTDHPDGDIRAYPLIGKTSEIRYLIKGGQHRAAVLAALGFEHIPVIVLRTLRFDEVPYWPKVRGGLLGRGEAMEVFERLFDGHPPPKAVPPEWLV
jgi:hypothetical protein